MKKKTEEDLPREVNLLNVDMVDLDPREDPSPNCLTLIRDAKKVKTVQRNSIPCKSILISLSMRS